VIFCFAIVEITRKVIVCFSVKANWLQFTTKYSTQGPIRELFSEFTDFKMERKILFMKRHGNTSSIQLKDFLT
jgi:hypothetical protein